METIQAELRKSMHYLGMAKRNQAADKIDALLAQVEALTAENAQIRELMNMYNLGGWTDSLTLMQERDSYKKQCLDARRMLCVYKSGPHPYMDDGEASDCSTTPFIDFLREDLEVIQKKLQARDIAAIAKGTA